MSCDRCEESKVGGDRFCPFCGATLDGRFGPSREPLTFWRLVLISGIIAALQGILILICQAAVGWAMAGTVMEDVAGRTYPMYIITPHIETLFDLGDVGIMILYIAETIIVTACAILIIYQCARHFTEHNRDLSSLRDTAAFEMPVLLGILFMAELAFLLFCVIIGIDTGDGEIGKDGFTIFQYMNASVYEEFLCRFLMIGLPCFVLALMLKRTDSPKWKYLFGGAKNEKWMWVFVLFSAVMFGAGHLDNWGSWKFIPTFAFGILTGYLFLKYGIHVTIAMHFLNDFLGASLWITGDAALFTLGMMSVGLFSLPVVLDYARRAASAVRNRNSKS